MDSENDLTIAADFYGLRALGSALAAKFVALYEPGRIDRALHSVDPDR